MAQMMHQSLAVCRGVVASPRGHGMPLPARRPAPDHLKRVGSDALRATGPVRAHSPSSGSTRSLGRTSTVRSPLLASATHMVLSRKSSRSVLVRVISGTGSGPSRHSSASSCSTGAFAPGLTATEPVVRYRPLGLGLGLGLRLGSGSGPWSGSAWGWCQTRVTQGPSFPA